jgi:hypothetical protein
MLCDPEYRGNYGPFNEKIVSVAVWNVMPHTVRSIDRTDRRRTASNVALVQRKCSAGNDSLP